MSFSRRVARALEIQNRSVFRLLQGAILSLAVMCSPLHAQEADGLVAVIQEALLSADAQADPAAATEHAAEIVTAMTPAVTAYSDLEALAGGGDTKAAAALESLRADGVERDILVSILLGGLTGQLGQPQDDPMKRVELRVAIEERIEELRHPSLRMGAIGEYARRIGEEDPGFALQLLNDARGIVPEISDEEARFAALNTIAQGAATVEGDPFSALASEAILGMSDPRRRGEARLRIARNLLGTKGLAGKNLEDLEDGALSGAAEEAIDNKDFRKALLLSTALPLNESSTRYNLLKQITDGLLETREQSLLSVVLSSLADGSDQEDLNERLISGLMEADLPLIALELREMMLAGAYRVGLGFELSSTLREAGLTKMAAELLDQSAEELDALPGFEKNNALSIAIETAVSADDLARAQVFAGQLENPEVAERALSKLSKALADEGEIEAAGALISKIATPRYKNVALSGLGRAYAREGNLEKSREIAAAVEGTRERDRILAEVVRQTAGDGQFDEAQGLLQTIEDKEFKLKSLIYLARAFTDDNNEEAFRDALARAVEVRDSETDARTKDKFSRELARAMLSEEKLEAAERFAAEIDDEKMRAKVLSEIVGKRAESQDHSGAFGLLERHAEIRRYSEIYADVLVALSASRDFMEEAVRTVAGFDDIMLRVRTSRRIAEVQLARLDTYGYGLGHGTTQDFSGPSVAGAVDAAVGSSEPVIEIGEVAGLRVSVARNVSEPYRAYGFPDLNITAQTVRDNIPLPGSARVSVTLANLTPYNDKFGEDLSDGNSGLSHAARAQGQIEPWVIVLEDGVTTLGALASQLQAQGFSNLLEEQGSIVTLRAPLLVAEGAELVMSGLEVGQYRLSASAGAFIAVAGKLHVHDALVTSWDEDLQAPRYSTKKTRKVFRPYIVGWSNSEINIGGSILDGLGYAAPKSFGLAFSAGPKAVAENLEDKRAPRGIVVDNHFHNFEYGLYTYEAEDLVLIGNEYKDNVLYAVDPHDRSHRLLIALNTAYGTMAKHGIIISREVNDSWKVGNVSYDNAGSGFMIDRNSVENFVYGNVAFANRQDGMTFFESSCNLVAANDFSNNGRSGIKIRNSWEIAVHDNRLSANKEAAIHGYVNNLQASEANAGRDFEQDPYVPVTTFSASNNFISRNGAGIKVNGASGFSASKNRFLHQSSYLIDGDARQLLGQVLRYQQDSNLILSASKCMPRRPEGYSCRFRDEGYFSGDGQSVMFNEQSPGYCVDVQGSLQGASF